MKDYIFVLFFLFIAPIFVCFAQSQYSQKRSFVTIKTGSITAVYFPLGGTICRAVNRDHLRHNIKCSVMSTSGSIFNINSLRGESSGIGIAQGDWQYYAFKGENVFSELGPMKELRYLFSLHSEAFTVVARADADVSTVNDILGKRVNIGVPGSGVRSTMELLMKVKGWKKSDFRLASERKTSEQAEALCNNELDVAIFMNGHPSAAIQEASSACNIAIVPVTEEDVPEIFNKTKFPFYINTIIKGGLYPGSPHDIGTFGTKALVLTTSDLADDIVYEIIKSVFDDFDSFKSSYPMLHNIEIEDMVSDTYGDIPMHNGARRYFNDIGILKQ